MRLRTVGGLANGVSTEFPTRRLGGPIASSDARTSVVGGPVEVLSSASASAAVSAADVAPRRTIGPHDERGLRSVVGRRVVDVDVVG